MRLRAYGETKLRQKRVRSREPMEPGEVRHEAIKVSSLPAKMTVVIRPAIPFWMLCIRLLKSECPFLTGNVMEMARFGVVSISADSRGRVFVALYTYGCMYDRISNGNRTDSTYYCSLVTGIY